jgi:hypothetical protein
VKRVLLLSGGAFKGALQVPVIEKLGVDYDEIRGTSVGAINGVMAASGRLAELRAIWESVDGTDRFLEPTPFAKWGFWNLEPLRDLMGSHQIKASNLHTRFGVGIVLPDRDEHVVPAWTSLGPEGHEIGLQDGVLASAAIAGLFAGVDVDWGGRRVLAADGGHEHVLPPAPDGATHVDAVFCYPVEPGILTRRPKQVDGRIERFVWAVDKALHVPTRGDFETLKALALSGVRVRVFAPREDPGGMLDAKAETIKRRLDIGARMAEAPIWSCCGHRLRTIPPGRVLVCSRPAGHDGHHAGDKFEWVTPRGD